MQSNSSFGMNNVVIKYIDVIIDRDLKLKEHLEYTC